MKTLLQEQWLPLSLQETWDYFATPRNLDAITPLNMSFRITSEVPATMYEGMMITYKISPFWNIEMDWCTEITHIRPLEYFTDEQRKGPFNIWHHEHHFKPLNGGVLMTDRLVYDIGKSLAGWVAGQLIVHKRVQGIFDYRRQKLTELFPAKQAGA